MKPVLIHDFLHILLVARYKKRLTVSPPTMNPANITAINLQIEAYDICNRLEYAPHRIAFSNAINALRGATEYITTLEQAASIKWITAGTMGQFIVEAADGRVPYLLAELRAAELG